MDEKIIKVKRDYYKKWREKHPENIKRAQDAFWKRKLEEMEKEAREQDPGEA